MAVVFGRKKNVGIVLIFKGNCCLYCAKKTWKINGKYSVYRVIISRNKQWDRPPEVPKLSGHHLIFVSYSSHLLFSF